VVGTVNWLRSSVSRFSNGRAHHRRRANVVDELQRLDPEALRSDAYERAQEVLTATGEPGEQVDVMYLLARCVPMATIASALGMADPARTAEAVIATAGGYFPGADAQAQHLADEGTSKLLGMLVPAQIPVIVARIALMVQACDATAGLIGMALLQLQGVSETGRDWTIDGLIAEVARHGPPLGTIRRVATRSLDFDNRRIAAGDAVLCSVDTANRDPAVFDHPDRFDPTRRGRPSLTFGYGVRPCPAARHALMLASGVVGAVLECCDLPLAGRVDYEDSALRIPKRVYVLLK
jgi:cytochrome P450